MKFGLYAVAVAFTLFSQAVAVFHCDIPSSPSCPVGYQCCGPISVKTGGTCYPDGEICPL